MLLEETPAILSLETLCEDHGFSYHWTSGQKPHLIRNGKSIDCNISNYVPFVVPGLSASSSSTTPSLTSSSSSLKDSVFDVDRYNENPETERSGSASGELRGDPLHRPPETENIDPQEPKIKIKMENQKKYKEIYRVNCQIGYRNSEIIWSMNVVR